MSGAPHPYLADLLDETVAFIRRYVVFGDLEADACAIWNAHTYVYDRASATPYLHPHSPDPGSGKTTLLDVLSVIACDAQQVDNMTEAVLFRLIDSRKPTLLIDEVDAVFGKKNSDSAEGIRQILNSGYRRGKLAFRCVPPTHEVVGFDVYCPKATAGLHRLPGTLAHRSIPIAMSPPRPDDIYEDFDFEEAEAEAETLRMNLRSWADESDGALTSPLLKPAKLLELDGRGNEIWRVLFRIADMAGGDWPERARVAALGLTARQFQLDDASVGVKLLSHIRDIFVDERMSCKSVADALNEDEGLTYGGWNDGKGISTRELGQKLRPYRIHAKPIRIDGTRAGNGYEREQFEDVWSRYLPPETTLTTGTTGTSGSQIQETVFEEPVQPSFVPVFGGGANPHGQRGVPVVPDVPISVPVVEKPANPHEQRDVPDVPVSGANQGVDIPYLGDAGYLGALGRARLGGHITDREHLEAKRVHLLCRMAMKSRLNGEAA
jgi:hypothetical protein